MEVTLSFKGRQECVSLAPGAGTDDLYETTAVRFSLDRGTVKLMLKGKQVPRATATADTALKPGLKILVMGSVASDVDDVRAARSDPTIRSFDSEDAAARHHLQQQSREEQSVWGTPQHPEYRFCRFEACTWQSFGTRPSSTTPHAFEARNLLLKLAHDPAIVAILAEREWTVGLLAEQDPIDDRLQEKMEGGGKRLLGYNTNMGAEIHLRLRSHDLGGFLPYPALVDTLLHELCHNEVGPHNDQFWHLFCQLKADYLRTLTSLSRAGQVHAGQSPLALAAATAEAADVRSAVLAALERDRQMPVSQMHADLLDAYLATSAAVRGGLANASNGHVGGGGRKLGGVTMATGSVGADGALDASWRPRRS